MNFDNDIEYGILSYQTLLISAINKRSLGIHRSLADEPEECLIAISHLEVVENYLKDKFPDNKEKIKQLIPSIQSVDQDKTDAQAVRTSKLIYDYLLTGSTMESVLENRQASREEIEVYIQNKVSTVLTNSILEEWQFSNESDNKKVLEEFARVVVRAGINFFIDGHNKSGPAINAAFVSGVGVLRIWVDRNSGVKFV
jgi:hypothetical protein